MKAKGDRLRSLRDESGITQKQLADYLEVDQSYISKFEKNERQLSVEVLEKCASLFGYEVNIFFDDCFSESGMRTAFRATNLNIADFAAIAYINRIALNLKRMEELDREG
ncbi:MAG TPA: XRE family transcriptional regulator [Erysipelotrichaceae bacterium]|nr:XRE family transcriptional regulator [Erysipelotrichaceae bacterium]